MSLYPNGRREGESETDFCRRMGWGPGTKLTADDGTVIELVFVGHNKILAYWNGEKREIDTTIGCRDWMEVSVSRTEFRIVHKTPRVMEDVLMPSKEHAEEYIRRAEKLLAIPGGLKIQSRTVTEWKDM